MLRHRLAFIALLLGFAAGPVRAQPPIWIVHGPHATVVLFGSVHLLPAGLQWEPQRLRLALTKASDVWFEIPMDPAAGQEAGQAALSRGVLPAGETLDTALSPATRLRLAAAAAKLGMPVEGLQRLRPWLADISLSLAAYRMQGALQQDGVERRLSAQLPKTVERKAFETPAEQIEALAATPPADQVASLEETLADLEQGDDAYGKLVKAWMAGDVQALRREALDPLMTSAPGAYRILVADRNHRWMDAVRGRLAGHGVAVMVVGVGHLVGPDGLPILLRADGYAVDGP